MKGSQELIAYFNKREKELGEKATKFNMFLEGYAAGYNDTKAIDEANPSDAVIMRILNAIGYEEESWIPIVRKNLKVMKE